MNDENITKEEKLNKKKILIIISIVFIVVVILAVVLLLFNKNNKESFSTKEEITNKKINKEEKNNNSKKNDDNSSSSKKEFVKLEDNSSNVFSNSLVNYLNHVLVEDGSNNLSDANNRMLYISMELAPVQNITTDPGQGVAYVDYDVFKNKYIEVYGDNFNFDQDLSNYKSKNLCNNYPSIAGQNKICWMANLGVVGPRSYYIEKESPSSDNKFYYIEGKYQKVYPNNDFENGVFKIEYTLNNNNSYLYSISLKKE